jgi:prepilin-type N-terminal cleavage/methylation domain-containing protein
MMRHITTLTRAGFTLTELLFAIALMAILSSMALPAFFEWQQNMSFKQAANDIANAFKTAKSKAITSNQQYGVKFVPAARSYQFAKYSCNSTNTQCIWVYYGTPAVLSNKITLNLNAAAANPVSPAPNIRFSNNGSTFDNYSVSVKESASTRYTVAVMRTGRIKVLKIK